ncbi:MAG: Uncharacterised protein [Flavobacteriia bacterium]|nr:MAG: Uncharacterised protein [Flavobacteriia bacterium]
MKRATRLLLLKTLALFSVVRWWNIVLLIAAQYLTAIFVLNEPARFLTTIADPLLHFLVLSTGLVVASGFIINNFYDKEKDLVNRPKQTAFELMLSQPTALNLYLLFNLLALVISAGISFRAVLFFTAYALSLWLYSHKVKKLPVVANVIKALLTFVPFFAVFIYYKNPHWGLVSYAFFLFTLELGRALVKDVVFLKGDVIYNYPTVPVLTGRMGLKRHLMAINLSGWAFFFAIYYHSQALSPLLGSFLLCCMGLQSMTAVILSQWLGKPKKAKWLHNLYKAILIAGIGMLPFL